jgi:pyridoxamine 5'-phosphate oxidase
VSLLFYDHGERVQLRVDGTAALHHGDAVAALAWQGSQRMSRVCYGAVPGPGGLIAAHDAFTLPETDQAVAAGEVNFGAVVVHILGLEVLCLKALRNQRAAFDLQADTATWLAP